jgi:hypothetical protein
MIHCIVIFFKFDYFIEDFLSVNSNMQSADLLRDLFQFPTITYILSYGGINRNNIGICGVSDEITRPGLVIGVGQDVDECLKNCIIVTPPEDMNIVFNHENIVYKNITYNYRELCIGKYENSCLLLSDKDDDKYTPLWKLPDHVIEHVFPKKIKIGVTLIDKEIHVIKMEGNQISWKQKLELLTEEKHGEGHEVIFHYDDIIKNCYLIKDEGKYNLNDCQLIKWQDKLALNSSMRDSNGTLISKNVMIVLGTCPLPDQYD